jgi:hypothetical protein
MPVATTAEQGHLALVKEMRSEAEMRFFYVVRAVSDRWEVTFGSEGTRFVYAGREEALGVAIGAAQRHWELQHCPSGVRFEHDGRVEDIAEFGGTRTHAA